MRTAERDVTSTAELLLAASDPAVRRIVVRGDLRAVRAFRLHPGQSLVGASPRPIMHFAPGQEGVCLTSDNEVADISLRVEPDRRAIWNDTTVESLGRLVLRRVVCVGSIELVARDRVRAGHVEVEDVFVESADVRARTLRPKGFGVEVVPGAFTLWNQQADPRSTITAELRGLAAGLAGAPVRGGGVFVSGAGDAGGRLVIGSLETGAIHSDGGIGAGTPDRITGGVFTVHGTYVGTVHNVGPVTTYGPNDMALDNWGSVDRWVTDAKVTSHGPSAIGFVNFGSIDRLEVTAPIETYGTGSRGFNVYAGTIRSVKLDRIVTHGDGAVGIQIGRPIGALAVRAGIETHGATGDSLVKGVVEQLSAVGLSIKPGGSIQNVSIDGGISTHGAGSVPLELQGTVESFHVSGGIRGS